MKYSIFVNPVVSETLSYLAEKRFPVRVAYKLANILKAIAAEDETYNKLRIDLLKKYAELDENGEFVVDVNGNAKISDLDGFNSEWADLINIEVEVKDSLTFSEIESAELTGAAVMALVDQGILKE